MEVTAEKWVAIINPVAGAGRGARAWPEIHQVLRDNNIVPECLFTEHRYHAVELTVMAVIKGYRRIIVVGGDGTLHEVVNGLFIQKEVATADVVLGIFPLGTGNDWGRTFGFPRDYREAASIIAAGHTFMQDVGLVSYHESGYGQSRYFVNVSGFGFNSCVIRQYDKLKEAGKTGKGIYMWSLLKALIKYHTGNMHIRIDGLSAAHGRIFSAAVGIGRSNGGGMMQLPLAIPDDGLLDLTVIRRIRKLKVIRSLKSLYNRTIYNISEVSHHRGKMVEVEAPSTTMLEADGEILGEPPYEFTIIEKAVRVIIPPAYLLNAVKTEDPY